MQKFHKIVYKIHTKNATTSATRKTEEKVILRPNPRIANNIFNTMPIMHATKAMAKAGKRKINNRQSRTIPKQANTAVTSMLPV